MISFYKFLKNIALVFSISSSRKVKAPLLITEDGVVLDGNSRLRIAKAIGLKTVPVVRIHCFVENVNPSELTESY